MKNTFEVIYPNPEDTDLLHMAATIINLYADLGIMLSVTVEQLTKIAAQRLLALAVTTNNDNPQVIGSAGITFQYPDDKLEFGAWAVKNDWIEHGVGKILLGSILAQTKGKQVIAFGNKNSGPIFKKLGAPTIPHISMHKSAFDPCTLCKCDKSAIKNGEKCMDKIFDLSGIK